MSKAQSSSEFEVHLDLFEGPLDLLCHLIEKNNLNIFDIPIADITKEYLSYLQLMRALAIEVAGEFLVMATTLMQIKTKMLLPRQDPSESNQADPRKELVDRLLLHQKFTTIARELDTRSQWIAQYAPRPAPVFETQEYTVVQNIFDLFNVFKNILDKYEASHGASHAISADPHPVEAKIRQILDLLEAKKSFPLDAVFAQESTRPGLISCFLAILELIKRGVLVVLQKQPFGEIYLSQLKIT